MSDSIFVLCIILIVCVVPYWLKLHYQKQKTVPAAEETMTPEQVQSLQSCAEDLDQRVQNLEAILDVEAPSWRRKYG